MYNSAIQIQVHMDADLGLYYLFKKYMQGVPYGISFNKNEAFNLPPLTNILKYVWKPVSRI
jgi:hypothetical protein